MLLMARMKVVFLTLFGTPQRTLHLQSLLQVTRNIKSSSSMKQTIPLPMYSSFSERLLRSSLPTVDLSSPVTTSIRLPNLFIRCTIIDFSINKRNKPTIAAEFFSRLNDILDQEKIKSDKKVVAQLINKHFPDWRRVLNECQRYSVGGKIDSGILAAFNNVEIDQLTKILKEKNFSELRLWVTQNVTNDPESLFRSVYDSFFITMIPTSIPSAVLVLAKYSEYATKVADHEINTLACLTEIMAECSFK